MIARYSARYGPNVGPAADGRANGARKAVALKNLAHNFGHGHGAQWRGGCALPDVDVATNLLGVKLARGGGGGQGLKKLEFTRLMALFQPNTATGKLKAVMMPTTPRGFQFSSK